MATLYTEFRNEGEESADEHTDISDDALDEISVEEDEEDGNKKVLTEKGEGEEEEDIDHDRHDDLDPL